MSEMIEDYDVYELLGKGGFAKVYRGKSKNTGLAVAIKHIEKRHLGEELKNRVIQEVGIHSRLKHPNILELYSYFEDVHYVYLVLELCNNGELQQHLKKCGKLSEDNARRYMAQIVDAMLYLHKNNILHRDLTLANMLLGSDMNLRIADFGLATIVDREKEKHYTMCGTPNYISPEVVNRTSHGLEADVWSLGCMFYTFLSGNPPFDTDTVRGTLTRVVKGEFAPLKDISPEAKDLIHKLLQIKPEDRIALQDVMEHPFMRKRSKGSCHIKANQNLSIDSGRGTGMMTTLSTMHWPQENTVLEKLDTTRVPPIRHISKNTIVNILENGDVCLEFIKKRRSEEHVVKVFAVSGDGNQINIYQPNGGKGVPVEDQLITLHSPSMSYTFDDLQMTAARYAKTYATTFRFVQLVRSKTPKVTLYTEKCKCMLMENGPGADFEAKFYSGTKFRSTGQSLFLESGDKLTQDTQELLEYVKKAKEQCQKVETVLSDMQQVCCLSAELFPIIMGRRPSVGLNDSGKFSTTSLSTASDEHSISSTNSNRMSSFDSTMVSSVTSDCGGQKGKSLDSSHSYGMHSQSLTPDPRHLQRNSKKHVIPDFGTVKFGDAGFRAEFIDKTEMCMSRSGTVQFKDQKGRLMKYHGKDKMPVEVERRLKKVLEIMETKQLGVHTGP